MPTDELRPDLDGQTPRERFLRSAAIYLLRLLVLGAGLSAVTYGYQILLGGPEPVHPYAFYFPWKYFAYGAVFLTAATFGRGRREWTMGIVSTVCLFYLWTVCPLLVGWVAVLVPTLYVLLGSEDVPGWTASCRFWGGIFVGLIVLPKVVQGVVFHFAHGSLLDVNQNLFSGLCACDTPITTMSGGGGLVLAGGFWEHLAYLLFVPQITGMLNVSPAEMSARWGVQRGDLGTRVRGGGLGVGQNSRDPVSGAASATYLGGTTEASRRCEPHPGGHCGACLLTTYLDWAVAHQRESLT